MGIRKFLEGIAGHTFSDPASPSGDKYLDYLRKKEQERRNEIEKRILKKRLKQTQQVQFKKIVKGDMVSGSYKKKYKNYKMRL